MNTIKLIRKQTLKRMLADAGEMGFVEGVMAGVSLKMMDSTQLGKVYPGYNAVAETERILERRL